MKNLNVQIASLAVAAGVVAYTLYQEHKLQKEFDRLDREAEEATDRLNARLYDLQDRLRNPRRDVDSGGNVEVISIVRE